eukprot:357859-Chlamydomonas_euryale.AAC.15
MSLVSSPTSSEQLSTAILDPRLKVNAVCMHDWAGLAGRQHILPALVLRHLNDIVSKRAVGRRLATWKVTRRIHDAWRLVCRTAFETRPLQCACAIPFSPFHAPFLLSLPPCLPSVALHVPFPPLPSPLSPGAPSPPSGHQRTCMPRSRTRARSYARAASASESNNPR